MKNCECRWPQSVAQLYCMVATMTIPSDDMSAIRVRRPKLSSATNKLRMSTRNLGSRCSHPTTTPYVTLAEQDDISGRPMYAMGSVVAV